MRCIIDCGSTKADWVDIDSARSIQTDGWNALTTPPDAIVATIRQAIDLFEERAEQLWIYGAGCTPQRGAWLKQLIEEEVGVPALVESDLVAAVRATCGAESGIACIIGTGSNSCCWDGTAIREHTPALGYILGDEGSGAALGKQLVADYLKNQLDGELKEAFEKEYGAITSEEVVQRVYRESAPNRWLASHAPFLHEHLDTVYCYNLVCDQFVSFLTRNVLQYLTAKETPIHFVGSVAYHFKEVLEIAVEEVGLQLGSVQQRPLEGLLKWHRENP